MNNWNWQEACATGSATFADRVPCPFNSILAIAVKTTQNSTRKEDGADTNDKDFGGGSTSCARLLSRERERDQEGQERLEATQVARLPAGATMAALLLTLLLLFTSLAAPALVASQTNSSSWRTLSGNPPLVVARGGFSGLFPSSSSSAYQLAVTLGLPDLVLWCDVRLTKDSVGICSSSLELKNTTSIEQLYPEGQTSYLVNGVSVRGWFPIDYTLDQLANVTLLQGIYSRTAIFDGVFPLEVVEQVAPEYRPSGYWLNIQHDIFYREHNLSMRSYVLGVMRSIVVDYISSPEVGFLRSIVSRVNLNRTKLIFQFLGSEEIEPSTNQTYESLLRNLTFVKSFASGILLPKNYIWPVNADLYLLPHSNIVADAHQEGLEVYASDFANDFPLAYNYSYDPVAEVLSFIDNSQFSVDGLLTDFPVSSSEAIACFANTSRNSLGQDTEGLVVISHNGANGAENDDLGSPLRVWVQVDGSQDCH